MTPDDARHHRVRSCLRIAFIAGQEVERCREAGEPVVADALTAMGRKEFLETWVPAGDSFDAAELP